MFLVPATALALPSRRFSAGSCQVAFLARTEERLKRPEKEIPGSRGYVCDISNLDHLRDTIAKIRTEMGHIHVAVHNAAQG